jgi:hypothetical protein
MKILSLFFCKFFQFSKYIGNAADDSPYAYKAMWILTVFLALNVLTLYAYYKCFFENSNDFFLSKAIEIVVVLLIAVALYLAFLRGKKYSAIYEEFRQNQHFSGRFGTWVTILYMAATVALLTSLIWLKCRA